MEDLSKERLETSLTDVRAEICLLEAELCRLEGHLPSEPASIDGSEAERRSGRRRMIVSRLDELEATSAGLRARIERLGQAG
jgi:uncharacterized small protein (DUF1192 family)